MTFTVYGLPPSPFVRKVCAFLSAKGLEYDVTPVNPFAADEKFQKISPLSKMPAFVDHSAGEGFSLADSSVICHYVERAYPENPMLPSSPSEYGKALWFEEYADTEMASKFAGGVFRPAILPQVFGKEPDFKTAEENARACIPVINSYIEASLEGKEWLAGDMYSLADIAVGAQYGNLAFCGYSPSNSRWPVLAAYLKRIGEQESFIKHHLEAATSLAAVKTLSFEESL